MINSAAAAIPANRPLIINPSVTNRAGEAQIKVTRRRRTFDTLNLTVCDDRTLHRARHLHKRVG